MRIQWLAVLAALHSASGSHADEKAKLIVEIPIAKEGRLIVLPITVEEHEYAFLFDTGSSFTVYDTSLRHHLGKTSGEIRIASAGNKRTQAFKSPPAKLGALSLQTGKPVYCQDLAFVRKATALDIRGVVGIEPFLKYVVQIDSDQGTFTVFDPDLQGSADWGEPIPLSVHWRGTPFVTAKVPWGDLAQFLVDTGDASAGSLEPLLFEHLLQNRSLVPAEFTTVGTIRGVEQRRSGRIRSFELGPFRHARLLLGEESPASLGLAYWSRYRVTFDFSNMILYLQKGKLYEAHFPPEMSGLRLGYANEKLLVHAVDQDESAGGTGIQAGDVILAIQGRPAGQYDLFELYRRLFTVTGQQISMNIKRGEEVFDVSFVLSPKAHKQQANTAKKHTPASVPVEAMGDN